MDTTEARQALLALKQELASRVERTHQRLHQRDERVSANFSEQSVEMESQELVMSLDADGRAELRAIDSALERIKAGTYGECTRCGNMIADARLKALPYAALCIECARATEK